MRLVDGRFRGPRASFAVVAVAAIGLALAASVPAIWWEPLHFDEATTLEFAPRAPWDIVRDVVVDRGGAPAFFFVEHVTLRVPGGLVGLRGPPLVFLVVALPFVYLVARELARPEEAAAATLAVAVAPVVASAATFARMYTFLLAAVYAAAYLAARLARRPTRWRLVAAGAACGAVAYVHPIGPLYGALALLLCFHASPGSVREVAHAARPAVLGFLVALLPYSSTLAVVRSRYRVASPDSGFLETTAGRTVPEEALHALTPMGTVGAVTIGVLATVGIVALARRSARRATILAAWIVVPVVFFTVVPAGNTRFFARYVLPIAPLLLLLAVIGAGAVGALVGRRRAAVALAAVALVVAAGLEDVRRLQRLHALDLRQVVTQLRASSLRPLVLFSSTGTPAADRPPELIDSYLALSLEELTRMEELPAIDPRYEPGVRGRGAAALAEFASRDEDRAAGVWVFSGRSHRIARAERRLRVVPGVAAATIGERLLLVRSVARQGRLDLVATGCRVHLAWAAPVRADRLVRMILAIERDVLARERSSVRCALVER